MTADLVASSTQAGAEDMAALEALDPQARDLAVTRWLSEARVSLAHALETSDPARIANFKAEAATVVEATKQLGLSKEIQLDADEMVRRAERGLGQAIRKGQAEGTVASRGQVKHYNANGLDRANVAIQFPSDLANGKELTAAYVMAGEATDEEFDVAISEAKNDGDLSRANIVRKIKDQPSFQTRRQRADLIAELAAQGYSSRQMPKRVGVTDATVRLIARDFNIDIPADKIIGRTKRLDHTRMVESTVNALDDFVSAIDHIDFAEVDPRDAARWATSLNDSIRALNRFHKTIKEMAPHD